MSPEREHLHNVAHMVTAYVYSTLSYCKRKKVGCIIVNDHGNVIAIGYNGTPPGAKNCCEDEHGNTLPEVIHAEDNALRKLEKENKTAEGTTVFITMAPCLQCAKKLVNHKVKKVFFDEIYRSSDGIEYLKDNNIEVEQITIKQEEFCYDVVEQLR